MLAIPLQGFAAASMVLCGPNHASLAQPADSSQHDHGADASHHHHEATPAPGDDDNGVGDFLKFLGMKCGACSACCTLSAIPLAAVPSLAFLPSTSVAVPFFGSSCNGIVPDGLERPPSQHLA